MIETFKQLWQFGQKRHKELGTALLCALVQSGFGITQLLAVVAAVQVLVGSLAPEKGLVRVLALTLLCIGGNFAASYIMQIKALQAGLFTVADQRTQVARLLRCMPLGLFRQATAESITATLTSTLQGVEMASTMSMVMTVSGFFNAAAMFLFMLFYDWRIGLITGLGIVLYLWVVNWQMKVSRRDAPRRQAAQTKLAGSALSFLQGIRVTKAFCAAEGDTQLQAAVKESCDANIALTDTSMPSQFAAKVVIAVFESALLAATAYFTLLGQFSLQKAVVLLIFSFFAYGSLNQAGSVLGMIGLIESGLNEVAQIKAAPVLPDRQPAGAPADEAIQVSDVSFSYGEREVLHHITTGFAPGTLTAVIGPSGSGKTTLCRLLARFQDVSRGSITIGGVDVKNIPYETLMEKISIVFQNVYLFEDTILNNIRFGKPQASLEEVRAAAKAARCDDFIMSLPQGYDTMVMEGGVSLSGGEKQRISIARAILKDAPIIILDEATSALEAENEAAFFQAVEELIQHKTVIMIAHRLATVERADKIIALRGGHLVQEGSPDRLRSEQGLYADFLASRQAAKGWQLQQKTAE